MKKIVISLFACVILTSTALLSATYLFRGPGQGAAKAAPEPTIEESAAAVSGCPVEIAVVCLLAEKDQPSAQHRLAVAYSEGKGVAKDQVKAQVWWTIAAVRGNAPSQAMREASRRRLSAHQIAQADRLAWRWLAARDKSLAAAGGNEEHRRPPPRPSSSLRAPAKHLERPRDCGNLPESIPASNDGKMKIAGGQNTGARHRGRIGGKSSDRIQQNLKTRENDQCDYRTYGYRPCPVG